MATPAGGATIYSWNGDALSTSTDMNPTAMPSVSQVYSLTVSSGLGSGCSPATVYTTAVTVNPTPVATISAPYDLCFGSTVSVNAVPSGGATIFNWTGPQLSASSGITVTASPTATATYSLTVSSGAQPGCSPATIYSATILVDYLPVYTASVTPAAVCSGGAFLLGGTTGASFTSSDEPAVYNWYGPSGFISSTDASLSLLATESGPGVYTLSVVSGACNQVMTTGAVTVDVIPTFTVSAASDFCVGGTITLNAANSGLPTIGPSNYSWTGPAGYSSSATSFQTTTVFTATGTNNSGVYTLTALFSEENCPTTVAYTGSLNVASQPSGTVSISTPGIICGGTTEVIAASMSDGSGTVTYNWSGPGISGTPSGSDNSYTVSPTSSGVYTVEVDYSGVGCTSQIMTTAAINAYNYPVWTGALSTDWNTSGNWLCGVVPGATDSVLILSGTTYGAMINASAGIGYAGTLMLNQGANITIPGSADLTITGDLVNNGTINGSGTLALIGSSSETISGTGVVNNITLNNSLGAAMGTNATIPGDTMTVLGQMNIISGSFNTNNRLVLYATTDSVTVPAFGRISALPVGSTVSGKVIMQQYMTLPHRAYLFWGHPFTDSTDLAQLENYIDVTGPYGSARGFTMTVSNSPSAYWYDTRHSNSSITGGSGDPGWMPFNWCVDTFVQTTGQYSGADTNLIHPFEGIRFYFRGNKGEGIDGTTPVPLPTVVRQWGQVNQGDVTVPLVKGTQNAYEDYNMISNPYPSPVDIAQVIFRDSASTNTHFFYVWSGPAAAAGAFHTFNSSVTQHYILGENECFQVRAANTSSQLVFHESDKAVRLTEVLLKAGPGELPHLGLL